MSASSWFQNFSDSGKSVPEMFFGSMTPMSEDQYYSSGYQGDNPNAFFNKISDWLGFTNTQADYDKWKAGYNAWYEQKANNSARAWDEYMASTQYQRAVKDLEAAGLNPWLALHSGVSGSYQTTAGSGSSARYQSTQSKKDGTLTAVAMLVIACARLFAAL